MITLLHLSLSSDITTHETNLATCIDDFYRNKQYVWQIQGYDTPCTIIITLTIFTAYLIMLGFSLSPPAMRKQNMTQVFSSYNHKNAKSTL